MDIHHLSYYLEGLKTGDRHILAQAITLVESVSPKHRDLARELVEGVLPHSGKAIRVGISGVPGAGKSTFIESFGLLLVGKGHKVAVLAVDPSSGRSGGSIMADKIRMEKLSTHPNAIIRPTPAGGRTGGVARMTREGMILCEAAGFDVILVETVGVGQSETAVADMVDFFLVLMLTGAGDILQNIKRGILELADAVAVNKADGDNIEAANRTREELESALHLLNPTSEVLTPAVLTCSALNSFGLTELWQIITTRHQKLSDSGELQKKRSDQALRWMWSLIEEGLRERFFNHPEVRIKMADFESRILKRRMLPTTAARRLLGYLDYKLK